MFKDSLIVLKGKKEVFFEYLERLKNESSTEKYWLNRLFSRLRNWKLKWYLVNEWLREFQKSINLSYKRYFEPHFKVIYFLHFIKTKQYNLIIDFGIYWTLRL